MWIVHPASAVQLPDKNKVYDGMDAERLGRSAQGMDIVMGGGLLERQAIEYALERHGKRILHLAYSYLHDRAEAEDVLQDTVVKYLQKKPVFESLEHEKAWMLRVAINLCKNRLKSSWNRTKAELTDDLPSSGIPEENIMLYEAVQALPPKYREVVHLYYYEDMSSRQIASILEKRESTVRSLLLRARTMLKDDLREEVLYGRV